MPDIELRELNHALYATGATMVLYSLTNNRLLVRAMFSGFTDSTPLNEQHATKARAALEARGTQDCTIINFGNGYAVCCSWHLADVTLQTLRKVASLTQGEQDPLFTGKQRDA